jgi:hypothetical protein
MGLRQGEEGPDARALWQCWLNKGTRGFDANQRLIPFGLYQGQRARDSSIRAATDEGFRMFRRKGLLSSAGRSVVVATIAVLALSMVEPPMAAAKSNGPVSKGVSAAVPSSGATDFSARRRYYRRGNAAAAAAMMGLMIGTIGAIAAQQRREDYYYNYGYGPGYYAYGPPVYYGYGPYYGRRYYYPY